MLIISSAGSQTPRRSSIWMGWGCPDLLWRDGKLSLIFRADSWKRRMWESSSFPEGKVGRMLLHSRKVILFCRRLGNKSEYVFGLASFIRVFGCRNGALPTIIFFLTCRKRLWKRARKKKMAVCWFFLWESPLKFSNSTSQSHNSHSGVMSVTVKTTLVCPENNELQTCLLAVWLEFKDL